MYIVYNKLAALGCSCFTKTQRMPQFLLCFTLLFANFYASSQTIPNASQQPQWVFPLFFEEGTGQKDTLYLGYDSAATSFLPVDSTFGETHIVDTQLNAFSVFWQSCCDGVLDTILKVNIGGNNGIHGPIQFRNAELPLTIWFDATLLNHPALPFPSQFPAPRAEALVWFDLPAIVPQVPSCDFSHPIILSDSLRVENSCGASDSITLDSWHGNPGTPAPELYIQLRAWQGQYLATHTQATLKMPRAYPNPTHSELHIEQLATPTHIAIVSATGQVVWQASNCLGHTYVPMEAMPAGVYFLTYRNNLYQFHHQKIIKL